MVALPSSRIPSVGLRPERERQLSVRDTVNVAAIRSSPSTTCTSRRSPDDAPAGIAQRGQCGHQPIRGRNAVASDTV